MADMDDKMRRDIVHVINLTPYYVLWQSDIDHFDLPEGKHLEVAWVPQQTVLNHTNIRFFITHGGLFSLLEALYFKVPIIGIPFTGEQCSYLQHAVNNGWALRLDYNNISLFSLKWAVKTVTKDLSIKDQAFYANILLRDQMYRPIDRAIHHINYVLRYGARQMRSPALTFGFIKYHSLDTALIWFTVAVVLAKILALVYCLCGGRFYKLCQDFGRKYNEIFFGSGWQLSQSQQRERHTEKKIHRQLFPKGQQEATCRPSRKKGLNFPNIPEEPVALPCLDLQHNEMVEPAFDGIVSKTVVVLKCVAVDEGVVSFVDAVEEGVADKLFVADNTTLIGISDGYESRLEAEEVPGMDDPHASDDIDKSTSKIGRNHARNKKLRLNRKSMPRGRKN